MTDKEILAELKMSYEYLSDIRENGCFDHCSGQLTGELKDMLNIAKRNIEDIYFSFYNTLDKENLRVKSLENDEKVYIARNVDGDYELGENFYNLTCGDANYYWYEDNDFLNDMELEYENKFYAKIWTTEYNRNQGIADDYDKVFTNLKDAIEDLRKYYDDGNCVCIELYDSSDNLYYNHDKESEDFYINDVKITKVSKELLEKYVINWVNHEKKPISDNLLYCENENGLFTAIDNRHNNCFTEDFDSENKVFDWLLDKVVDYEI